MRNSRKLALAAVVTSFVSQFFTYKSASGGGVLSRATDTNFYTGGAFVGSAGGTGWELHPHAWIMLAALAVVYNTGTHESAFWAKWGHWLTVLLIFLCGVPGSYVQGLGGALGGVAFALSIWAAVLHRREQRTPPPAA